MSKDYAATMNDCLYPDWEGGYLVDDHVWGDDGYCCVCGEHSMDKWGHARVDPTAGNEVNPPQSRRYESEDG